MTFLDKVFTKLHGVTESAFMKGINVINSKFS